MSVIYEPKGKAREYAPLASNIYRGCGHGCEYCYAPDIVRIDRPAFKEAGTRAESFMKSFRRDARRLQEAGNTDYILLCFTTDPYQPIDQELQLTRQCLEILREHDQTFQVLTKGGSRALRDLDLFRPGRDEFATTLTFWTAPISRRYEPDAAPPSDRLKTLKVFHDAGIRTWASLEPVLHPPSVFSLIRNYHERIDYWKVGKLNTHRTTPQHIKNTESKIDWHIFAEHVIALLLEYGQDFYIKQSLRPYVPPKYQHLLRWPDHHPRSKTPA